MKNIILKINIFLSLNFIFGCVDGVEVELWGE